MANLMKFKIITPEKVAYEGEATRMTIPTKSGEITVLPRHTPLVSLLKAGELTVENKEEFKEWFAISGGILEVRPGSEVVVLADISEHGSEINAERAKKARSDAEKAMMEKQTEGVDVGEFREIVDLEMARLKVHEHYTQKLND